MLNKPDDRHPWLRFPPLLVVGAFAVLAPIFILLTVQSLDRQRDNVTNLMVGKGAALIRSFEAGARTGMMRMMGASSFRLQHLLTETAQQPDIVFLLVTDQHGTILAHNDSERIGERYGDDLDLDQIVAGRELSWRIASTGAGGKVFEVYRVFQPVRGFNGSPAHHPLRHFANPDSSLSPSAQIIFVGLEMDSVEKARLEDARHTVVMALVLLLVCFAGLLIVFLLQAYSSTKSSLARLSLFSRRLTENMPIGLLALDQNGTVLALNRHGSFLLGLREDEVVGYQIDECLPGSLGRLARQQQGQAGTFHTELDCVLADGRHLPLELITASLADPSGHLSEKVLLFRDLSEIKELKQEIIRSQRLAAIGRLAAGVAHEIRNPLSSIKGFATYFRERYLGIEEDQQVATIMIQEVDRLNQVVGQLLEFARPLQVSRDWVSLPELLRHSLLMIEEDAGQQNVRIQHTIGTVPERVWLDGDRLKQVLLNLYLNAIDSMANGGNLEIALSVVDDLLEIRIADDGQGIAAEEIGSVFDPYYTTKASGTGLGLAIVHKIVEALGGEIEVNSRLGEGTEFVLRIPVAAEEQG